MTQPDALRRGAPDFEPSDTAAAPNSLWMRLAAVFAVLLGISCLLTSVVTGIDLAVSSWFFDASSGYWPVAQSPVWRAVRQVLWRLADMIFAVTVAVLLLRTLVPRWRSSRRASLGLVALSYALGPGLLVNLVLKEHWGRARPFQVKEFGGDHLFTPALMATDQCAHNCSFVGGEASSFAVLFFALFFMFRDRLPRPRFWTVLAPALLVAVFGSLLRVAFGHHFLSDIVFAWAMMFAVVAAVAAFFDLLDWDYRWPVK